jgi:hypothetical protein
MHCDPEDRGEQPSLYLHASALQPGEAVRIWWRERPEFDGKNGTFHGVQEPGGEFLVFVAASSEPVAFPFHAVVRTFKPGDRIQVLAPNEDLEAYEYDGQTGTYQNLKASPTGGVRFRVRLDASPDSGRLAIVVILRRCAVLPEAGPSWERLNQVGCPVV